jgi:hypothetical protein
VSLGIVTKVSNEEMSERLKGMLADLVSNANAIYDSVKEIREQGRSEGFSDFETDLLLKTYLEKGLGMDRAKYILHGRDRIAKQKSLTNNLGKNTKNDYNNVPEIPAPDYKVIVPDQVIDEAIAQQEQEQESPQQQEYKPDYALEDFKITGGKL